FYEAPHRIREALEDVVAILGSERHLVVARELTKIHEEFSRGTAEEVRTKLAERPSIRGEIVLLIGKAREVEASGIPVEEAVRALEERGISRMDAMKEVARARGISKREVYRRLTGR
ncbi:MAG: 16S rRNA (cytidine(1402)-2'-O)-methyltransferase, partial [Bryobacteraceae bacterium]